MINFRTNNFFNKKIRSTLLLMTILGFSMIFLLAQNNVTSPAAENSHETQVNSSSDEKPLFEGVENPLNITDYGNLYDYNKEVNVDNQQETNISYYLDENHNWKASQINISVNNIQDTRNWVNNSGFKAPNIFRVYVTGVETNHPYNQPHNPSSITNTIVGPSAFNPTYMRVHFTEIAFERYYDYLYVQDGSGNNYIITDLNGTNPRYNVYSPWIPGDTIQLTYRADNQDNYYGYKVDYYEYLNASSNYEVNSESWGFNYEENGASGTNIYGSGECGNATGMYVGLYGNFISYYQFDYTEGAFSELYQNITIPRGSAQNAYISFDYNVPFGLKSNDNYIYFKINNELVYSRGMRDVIDSGKNIWHNTGKIYMDLWVNNSPIFEDLLSEQNLNISVGIMSGSSVQLTYFEEAYQNIVWFDNVSLVITSSANSTQSDIDLKVNGISLDDNDWGSSNKVLVNVWDKNPIWLNFSTESPDLTFNLDTIIYGYHETQSTVGQTTNGGISYEILENGTIIWKFTHNFYMPAFYTDFSFTIFKPENWNFTSALDPTLQSRPYEYGNEGDTILQINKDNALYPGWWTFKATSPNFFNLSNTKLVGNTDLTFFTGESTVIKTQVNYSNQIPSDLEKTSVNLTIYDPNSNEWFSESKTPLSNGTVFFSKVYFDALNTTGGEYEYTLFWSNGTSLGGLNSSLFVVHNSLLSLLKPNDAISDLITDAFVGDIIPVRLKFFDSENNDSISSAIISYNWTSGTSYFEEAAIGIYETILDTSDLGSNGFYEIKIETSKIGFLDYNLTLKINLGEETSLTRLESDYNIELHANSTIKFRYYSLLTGDGIDGAKVDVNISNSNLYYIKNSVGGYYDIEFNTSFINNLGTYQLNFNFTAPSYEPQTHIYHFKIVEQSINIELYANSKKILDNGLIEAMFKQDSTFSLKASGTVDSNYISGAQVYWDSGLFSNEFVEYGDNWYNLSLTFSASNFTSGINSVSIKFEKENYVTTYFSFQLLLREQSVVLNASINDQPIPAEGALIEAMFKENITISAQAFAMGESIYLSGGNISLISGSFHSDFVETMPTWFNINFIIDGAYFDSGINTVSIKFEQENYTISYLSFQFFITAETVNLSLYTGAHEILSNNLITVTYYDKFSLSLRAMANAEKIYLNEGSATLVIGNYNQEFTENGLWYNITVVCDPDNFDLGINTVYISFIHPNYTTSKFYFQVLVNQIEINARTIDFQDSIEGYSGDSVLVRINLTETITTDIIENATVRYTWEFGLGTFKYAGMGIYEAKLTLPENIKGSYKVAVIISTNDILHKAKQTSFIVVISPKELPNYLLWIIIAGAAIIISVLGALSLRSYVMLPRRRKKEAELLSKTQNFKDMQNIQAIVLMHRYSGVPLYSKSYSILEKQKKELFAGFVQAITSIGEEIAGKRSSEEETKASNVQNLFELDFKYFHCVICDRGDLRIVVVLTEKASENLKNAIINLATGITLNLNDLIEHWDGALDTFENEIPPILRQYLDLYYKEPFMLNSVEYISELRKEVELPKMEVRVLNTVYSMAKSKKSFLLDYITETVHEENKDKIIEAIESLINNKIFLPTSQ